MLTALALLLLAGHVEAADSRVKHELPRAVPEPKPTNYYREAQKQAPSSVRRSRATTKALPNAAPSPVAPAAGVPGLNTNTAPQPTAQDPARTAEQLRQQQEELLRRAQNFDPTAPFAAKLAEYRNLLEHPAIKKTQAFFAQPAISRASLELLNHPKKENLLVAELALLLMMIVFKSWRLSLHDTWHRRLFVRAYCNALYFALAIAVLPLLVLGQPLADWLQAAFEYWRS
jgi:hypothetical protein